MNTFTPTYIYACKFERKKKVKEKNNERREEK